MIRFLLIALRALHRHRMVRLSGSCCHAARCQTRAPSTASQFEDRRWWALITLDWRGRFRVSVHFVFDGSIAVQSTCRRLLGLTAALVAACAIGPAGPHDALARADDRVPLGGGAGGLVHGDPLCTLTTIGTDGKGQLIGFTSAHCGGPGAPVVV